MLQPNGIIKDRFMMVSAIGESIQLNISRAKTALQLAAEGNIYAGIKDRVHSRRQLQLLARFGSHYGIDYTPLKPWRADPSRGQSIFAYEIHGAGLFFDGQVKALRLTEMGRFGNIVYQLLQACIMARQIGVKTIQVFPFAGGPPVGRYEFGGLIIEVAPIKPAKVPTLVGQFWQTDHFPQILLRYDQNEPLYIIDQILRPLFGHLLEAKPDVPDDAIIIHFRSGDIFSGSKIYPWYVQPPASYFVLAALNARDCHGITHAILVYEDAVNPTISLTEEALLAAGMRVTRQSASLLEDLLTVLNAVHLVAPFGTFCETLAMLSTKLRSYTAFRQFESHRHQYMGRASLMLQILRAHQVKMVRIKDPAWDYIRPLTWDRSEQQTNLLCTFPITSLALDYPQDDADDAYFEAYENFNPANWQPP